MSTLYMGTEGIVVKDAMRLVNQNINMLQGRLQDAIAKGDLTAQIRLFYEAKIESQKATLAWLQKAL